MAIHQISCVVIVDSAVRSSESDLIADRFDESSDTAENATLHSVGIVTEHDIVRFQAIQTRSQQNAGKNCDECALVRSQSRKLALNYTPGNRTAAGAAASRIAEMGQRSGDRNADQHSALVRPDRNACVIETLQRTTQQFGLDLDEVLANAIDHDSRLPLAIPGIECEEPPNLKIFLH